MQDSIVNIPPPIGTPLQKGVSLAQCLQGYWLVNEGGGGFVYDSVHNRHLSILPTEWTNLDKRFFIHTNTNSCKASIPDNSPLDIRTNQISFGGWIKPIVSNIYQVICGKIYDQNFRQYAMYLSASGTSNIFFSLKGVFENQNVAVTRPYKVNEWNLVMLTYDGSRIKIFINGLEAYSVAKTGNINNYPNSTFQIGAESSPSVGYYRCTGSLGPQGVWSRALTSEENMRLFVQPYVLFKKHLMK